MRPVRRAACGALVAASLIVLLCAAEAQSTPPSGFNERFYFPPDTPPLPAQPEPSSSPAKGLLVSPAEAATGGVPAGPAQQTQAPQTGTAVRDSALRQHDADKPMAVGRAAYYEHSGRTAMGQRYNPDLLTAAYRSVELGTRLRVVNLSNKRSVVVQVTDRSPAKMKFAIDLSRGSARALGITRRDGTAMVAVYRVRERSGESE